MKRSQYVSFISVVCGVLVLGACEQTDSTKKDDIIGAKDNEATIILPTNDETNVDAVHEEVKHIDVAFIGRKWASKEHATFQEVTWQSPLDADIRFILIDAKEVITQEKQKILQTWLEEDKVVLFYGENVQPEEVQEKIGWVIGVFDVKSNASFDFPYLLYGYGFSMTYEQYLPIFLSSNSSTQLEDKITTFLVKNQNF